MSARDIIIPTTIQDILSAISKYPDGVLVAGATWLMNKIYSGKMAVPSILISLDKIPDLKVFWPTDRFIELGAMTTFHDIGAVRKGMLPVLIQNRVSQIATYSIRNLATLGGALACTDTFKDIFAPLAVLDALVELRTQKNALWVNINRLVDEKGRPLSLNGILLSKIRIPTDNWDFSFSKSYGSGNRINGKTMLACVCRISKGLIAEIRIAEAGSCYIRSREAEMQLIGKKLPLNDSDISNALDIYSEIYNQIINSRKDSFRFLYSIKKLLACLDRGEF